MTIAASTEPAAGAATISDDLTRIPYRLYRDASVYAAEQRDLFGGATWNFLCLEAELPAAGSFRSTFVGETPVVITRDAAGTIFGFENRCAHRGALVCLEDRGTAKAFKCVYHAWSYNVRGDLIGVAFRNGIGGEGGMPPSFDLTQHGPRKLRIARLNGLVFGTFSDHTPDIETYLGPQVTDRVARVLKGREPVIIGRFTQMLPNNWKLYVENVKDSYHASILHLFFTTFEINRLSQSGGLIIDESGGNHVSYSAIDRSARADGEYVKQEIRSESGYRLADPSLLEGWDEFGDGITLQILSVFPGFVLQQIQNAIAVRQILPRGIEQTELNWTYLGFADDSPAQRRMRLRQGNLMGAGGYVSMEDGCVGGFVQRGIAGTQAETAVLEMGGSATESSRSRVTEASVRGFWKAYRQTLGPAL